MLDIDWIEADDSGIEADIGFRNVIAEIVWIGVSGQMGFSAIKSGEKWLDGLLVGFLCTEIL